MSTSDAIQFIGNLQRVDVKPGDRFVITVPGRVSLEMVERIRDGWKQFIGNEDTAQLLILDSGMTIGVIRDDADATSAPTDAH